MRIKLASIYCRHDGGSFDVVLDDGLDKKRFHLNRSYYGLYVCPMMWRYLDNFSSGAVCMVIRIIAL